MADPLFHNIPEDLKARRQFTMWKTINRAGKLTKVPFQTTGAEGDSSDPAKWTTYEGAVEAYHKGGYAGIGFTFDVLDPYAGVDLDHCISEDGSILPKAKAILDKLNSYSEISPSGTGVKVFLKAKNPVNIKKKDGKFQQGFESKKQGILEIEIYYGNRFFTLTGNRLTDYPATIEDRNQELTEIFKEVFKDRNYFSGDQEQGPQREDAGKVEPLSEDAATRLQALFDADPDFKTELFTPAPVGKRSDAEFHLCCRLWEAAFSEAEIYAIMTSSPQSKWMERGDGYRWDTIRKAVAKVEASHTPQMKILPTDKDEIEADEVGVCQFTGAVKKMVSVKTTNEDGKETSSKFLAWVSDCALHIHSETIAGDDTEFKFRGAGAVDKRAVEFTLPASALAEPRKFKAACINAFGAENRFGKLDFEIVQQISIYPKKMLRVEVPTWKENIPLLPGVDLVDKTEFRLSSKIPAAVHDGDLDKAKEILQKLLKVHKFAPILVASILGSPAIARWHKNDRFGLGLWGMTGTLKTTTALTAMGVYGIGYLDSPKLKAGKAGSTSVGAMEVFAAAGFLPQVYDDVKTVDSKDSQSYVAVIHSVLEGEEKARGKKDGGLRESREFTCIPIVTGEVRPQEASTSARVLNLNWSDANGPLLTEVQSSAALLPVIGYHWLRFLAETTLVLGKDFEAFRSKKMEEFLGLHYVNPGRLATIYSLLVSTWDLLESSPLGDVFTEAHESFKMALQEATAVQGAAVSAETEIARFMSALEELLASNPGLLMSKDGTKTIVGSIIGKEMEQGLFLLPTETLNELMRIKAFNQQPTIDSITQALNEKGLLIPGGKGKLLNRQRINGTRVYGWYIRVPSSKDTKGDGKGDGKNANNGPIVPHVPYVPPENERENFLSEKLLDKEGEKKTSENMGDKGDKGDSSIVDRLVDSDSYSKIDSKSVPFGVPFNKNEGDRAITPDCGIVEPTPATKSRLWDSISRKMKAIGRKDGKRKGLAVIDLQSDEAEVVKAAGWQQETTKTGITILWAPEKSIVATRLEA